jgi:signal transduction histidine kinase
LRAKTTSNRVRSLAAGFHALLRRFHGGIGLPLLAAACLVPSSHGENTNTPAARPAKSWLAIERVTVDGEVASTDMEALNGALRLSPGRHRLAFQYGPVETAADKPLRLRYKLEGVDEDWQEAGGAMRFTIRLSDPNNDPISFQDFPAVGESEGWGGSPTNSTFTDRKEVLTVGRNVSFIAIGLASGLSGGRFPDSLGMMVIDDVRVSVAPRTPGGQERLLYQCDFESGTDLDQENGTPGGWARALRQHPEMHRVVRAGPNPANHALAVLDTLPRIIAAWNCRLPQEVDLKAGDKLILEWKEMFTVGAGGTQTVSYKDVPPGKHVFRVMSVTPLGEPQGHSVALTILVPRLPFWRTPQFFVTLVVATGVILLGQALWLMRQRLKRQMERLKWQQAVEQERARIARDIHDDLGTNLTRISMLSQASRDTADISSIASIARQMTLAMDEIVWAVNPENDSIDGLATYLGGFAQELLTGAGLRCRLNFPVQLPQWSVTAEARHNVFLAFKEALNNVLKHSGANEVHITLTVEQAQFVLLVQDNGRGLPAESPQEKAVPPAQTRGRGGHGLANMRSRMEGIGGKFTLTSNAGQGTVVAFTVPMSSARYG